MRSIPLAPSALIVSTLAVLGFCSAANAASFQRIGNLPGQTSSGHRRNVGRRQRACRVFRAECHPVDAYRGCEKPGHQQRLCLVRLCRRKRHRRPAIRLQPFRWTSATGAVSLGDLPGGTSEGEAVDVSADGSVVVGYSNSAAGREAFRWSAATGIVGLGFVVPTSDNSLALGVAANASVIVGGSSDAQGTVKPVVWTSQGIRDVSCPSCKCGCFQRGLRKRIGGRGRR